MSRRRQQNPLLKRILLVSVVAHVIAIPVLAKFGVFEKVKQQRVSRGVNVEALPPEKEKPVAPKAEQKKAASTAKKLGGQANKGAKSNLNQPKVVASSAPAGAGGEGDPTVSTEGSGKVGSVPTENSKPETKTEPPKTEPTKNTETKPKEEPKTEPTKPKPEEKLKEEPKAEPAKHSPVLVAPEPVEQPQPEIPDDLRAEAIDKTTVVMIDVQADGTAGKVAVLTSSGVDELDAIALRAAKRWKFKPATSDGAPVSGRVRLHVHFKVD